MSGSDRLLNVMREVITTGDVGVIEAHVKEASWWTKRTYRKLQRLLEVDS